MLECSQLKRRYPDPVVVYNVMSMRLDDLHGDLAYPNQSEDVVN
jgi:hypothetical protein